MRERDSRLKEPDLDDGQRVPEPRDQIKAKQSLGAKFDPSQFHDVVLINGSVPLDVMEELVDRWVKEKHGT